MIIANPVYDTVFKYLMFDLDIARRFLSVILNVEILHLNFSQVENAQVLKEREASSSEVTLYRLDFIAEIATLNGVKTVLIELQKSWDDQDIYRFRNYLAQEYARHYTAHKNYLDELNRIRKERKRLKAENKPFPKLPENNVPQALPIVAIYIIDHKLYHDKMIIHTEPIYKDPNDNNKVIEGKDDFIENLTHNSYFIQIPHIPDEPNTELEEIFSIFNQHFLLPNDKRKIDYQKVLKDVNNKLLHDMLVILNKLSLDQKVAEEIEAREKGRKLIENLELKNWLKVAKVEDKLQEEKLRADEEKLRADKEKLRADEEKLRADEAENKMKRSKDFKINMILKMNNNKLDINIIADYCGISVDEINKIINNERNN